MVDSVKLETQNKSPLVNRHQPDSASAFLQSNLKDLKDNYSMIEMQIQTETNK